MKTELKDFQVDAVAALRDRFALMQAGAGVEMGAVLLSAPTGSGKTLMATALIESLLFGNEEDGTEGKPETVCLWLTDQPELNKQTRDKMAATSSALKDSLVILDGSFDAPRLQGGKVYFLNTQKLGAATNFTKHSDGRSFTFWETLAATVNADPSRFVLFLDEAHRGAKGKEAAEAETTMQKFVKGNGDMPAVPLVVAISATPDRFVKLCTETGRTLRQYVVEPALVRQSGLLKEFVDFYHPDEEQPSDVTMLREAIETWKTYDSQWSEYDYSDGEQPVRPVLLVQVKDAIAKSKALSSTDLEMVVSTLVKYVPHDQDDTHWLAHAFQDDVPHVISGTTVPYVAPSEISSDEQVRVVLFKTSLNTGWDCPRAETMVSFRPASDETNIAQLVGRMVRAPLARRVDADAHLNTVALYLPYYDKDTVKKVIDRLAGDPDNVPPIDFRSGKDAVTLIRDKTKEACFDVLATLPTWVIPRLRPMRPVPRVARLASLLAELGWENEPVKTYRSKLIDVLLAERTLLATDPEFEKRIAENRVLDIRRERVAYGSQGDDGDSATDEKLSKVAIADKNIEDLYAEAGRLLGEGLHREYLRTRKAQHAGDVPFDAFAVKLELHAIVTSPGVLDKVHAAADAQRVAWTKGYKAKLTAADEKAQQTWRDIEGSGTAPELSTITPLPSIEGRKSDTKWAKHLYIDGTGKYTEKLNSWETRALSRELDKDEVVGWLRNLDRKTWSLCAKRREGTKWVGIYPDFIIFRQTDGGVLADIIDAHLLDDQHAPERAAALAQFAADHAGSFGRIELIIYADKNDPDGKRLDLLDEATRSKVAVVSSHEHLKQLFNDAV